MGSKTKALVAVAFGGLLLAATLLSTGPAKAAAKDDATFKALITKYWDLWGQGKLDEVGKLYATDADLVFYDLEPVKYVGWPAYKAGVVPNLMSKFAELKFTLNDDFKATRRGNVAWTTITVHADGKLKAGSPVSVEIRHTAIWEKRGADWVIVHEQCSVPSSLPAAPAPK